MTAFHLLYRQLPPLKDWEREFFGKHCPVCSTDLFKLAGENGTIYACHECCCVFSTVKLRKKDRRRLLGEIFRSGVACQKVARLNKPLNRCPACHSALIKEEKSISDLDRDLIEWTEYFCRECGWVGELNAQCSRPICRRPAFAGLFLCVRPVLTLCGYLYYNVIRYNE